MAFDRELIYGSGFGYPLQFDAGTGGVSQADGRASVVASLIRLFDTSPGEEFMRPEYGCALQSLVFEQDTEGFRALALTVVQDAVYLWEPRVSNILDLQIERDDLRTPNMLLIRIFLRLIQDQTTYNFVYPFSIPG